MVTRNADSPHQKGDGVAISNPVVSVQQQCSRAGNTVFKCGPLFISSKGMGWTSWKKRWFILTRTSLVFFRSDPNSLSQKGSEVNLTLGGIDLNNSGRLCSVLVRADKKLLTVLFPDGRNGQALTLKAETLENLQEWKTALENAFSQAPSAAFSMGQNGIFQNNASDVLEGSSEQWRDKCNVKSLVGGRSIFLALEDIDGGPSFLEKALRFVEQHGVKVEGILRQAADVDEVRQRVQEYEHGKKEFSADEDAHVVADCVKHILRELPSSPVSASCCVSLLEAFRSDRGSRVTAMRAVICNTLPEANQRLLQRVLKMMKIVASHKAENLMSISAVAACMAPLLLRPLLAGDCEVMGDPDPGGNGSVQFLQAAAAANHAQAIVITLLEEFDTIFVTPYYATDGSAGEGLKSSDDEIMEENEYLAAQNDFDADDDRGHTLSRSFSESSGGCSDIYVNKVLEGLDSDLESHEIDKEFSFDDKSLRGYHTPLPQHDNLMIRSSLRSQSEKCSTILSMESEKISECNTTLTSPETKQTDATTTSVALSPSSCIKKSAEPIEAPDFKHPTLRSRTSAMMNLSMDSIGYSSEDEMVIQKLEMTRTDLQNKIAKETKGNAILHASLERRRLALHERRLALEQDVVRLQEQLLKERDLRTSLEATLNIPLEQLCIASSLVDKTRGELERIALAEADVIKLKRKIVDLHSQLNQQHWCGYVSLCRSCSVDWLNLDNQHTTKVQQRDAKTGDSVHQSERSQRSKDALHGAYGANDESVIKKDPLHLPKKHPPQKQPPGLSHNGSEVYTSLLEEPLIAGPTTCKMANGNDEGTVSTQSALTKLTNRLNNLKERRPLIANDLQLLEMSNNTLPEIPRLIGASQWMNPR